MRMSSDALPRRATHFSDGTALVCRSCYTPWPRCAASGLLKTCNQLPFAVLLPLIINTPPAVPRPRGECRSPKQHHPAEPLLRNAPPPPLRQGGQIWRPCRQRSPLDPGCVAALLKGGAVFPVPIL